MIDKDLNKRYLDLFCQSPFIRLVLIASDDEEMRLKCIEINCTEHGELSEKLRHLCINYGTINDNYICDGKNQIQSQFRIIDFLENAEKDMKSIVGQRYDSFARSAMNAVWSEASVYFHLKSKHVISSSVEPCKCTLSALGINLTDDLAALMYLSTSDKYFVGNSLLKQISLYVIHSDIERLSMVCMDIAHGNYAKRLRNIAMCINKKLRGIYYVDTILDALKYQEFSQGWESMYVRKYFAELALDGVRFINFNLNNNDVNDYYKELFLKESEYLKKQNLNSEAEYIGQFWDVWLENLIDEAKRYDREHGRFN
ncbi:hypothetical protein [Citrobacter amalonaticus]|uniref:hypothetical protein n=1 Tax=Citrobacter amalonaticus TaxID=35703 RepID=UPI000F66FE91|nr:hypothetical protein [Citrobacter amalonaticus]RSC52128.1 hypothetical protein EGW07_25590 [Citrobacter amalonaticus]